MKITFCIEDDGEKTELVRTSVDDTEYRDSKEVPWTAYIDMFKDWLLAQGYRFSEYHEWLFEQMDAGYIDPEKFKQIKEAVAKI